jgi:SAM-dependent methyltransferase
MRQINLTRRFAHLLASSFLCSKGRKLYEENTVNWTLPLTHFGKLQAGIYIILKDYSKGIFPPTFDDQAKAYEAEINYSNSLAGVNKSEVLAAGMTKPFWNTQYLRKYGGAFVRVIEIFESLGVGKGSKLLELGCGSGWMAEFLAIYGYCVTGTSLDPESIELGVRRACALEMKNIPAERLTFLVSAMESVSAVVPTNSFQGVFVYEALHHAFDWRQSIAESFKCLQTGGWLVLANEPNLMHTFISYRVGKLSNTHEIGMSRKQIVAHMKSCGFRQIKVISPKIDNFLAPLWIAALK